MKNRTIKGCEGWFLDELTVKLHTAGMNGGVCFDTLVARNVPVTVEFEYTPAIAARTWGRMEDAEEGASAELSILSISTIGPAWLDSESGSVLSFTVGQDISNLLNEHEIEAIEEALLKRVEST